jgi:hypothetical protein
MGQNQHLFSSNDLSAQLNQLRYEIQQAIRKETDDYIRNVNQEAYIASLESRFLIEELQVLNDQAYIASEGDREVAFQSMFGGTGLRNVHHVTFAVPFSGPKWLLNSRPNSFDFNPPRAEIYGNELRWTFSTENQTQEQIRGQFDSQVASVAKYAKWINEMIEPWNRNLRAAIEPTLRDRKERLNKGLVLAQSFGLPVRARNASQQPIPVPVTRKRIEISKPSAAVTPTERDRILNETIYEEILANLRNMNMVLERNPSAFQSLDEESLRWHFLVQLNNNFESGATGETFSKKGKTDIYLPADGRAVFIAECKFWSGAASFLPIIDQLLSYLTWRDSKTAILLFVKNKDFGAITSQIVSLTGNHTNHVKFLGEKHPAEFRFLLRSPNASNEFLTLAVMCFHLPPV